LLGVVVSVSSFKECLEILLVKQTSGTLLRAVLGVLWRVSMAGGETF
jgi:hypothetical protein